MKVIDLLNKIANGEEVPKKIRFRNDTYIYWEESGNKNIKYKNINDTEDGYTKFLFEDWIIDGILNDEIKILDEEDEFIDIEELDGSIGYINWNSEAVVLTNAINDLIKNQKKIIQKLKENK